MNDISLITEESLRTCETINSYLFKLSISPHELVNSKSDQRTQYAVLRPFFQVHPGEPVLSHGRDLLEQPLDFYELDVLPATQPVMSKHYRKPSGLVVFCFIDMVSAPHV